MLTLAAREPRNRIQGYFDETPAEKRRRQKAEKQRRDKDRAAKTETCFANEDWDTLVDLYRPLVVHHVYRLIFACELDFQMFDDLLQAGFVGLWNAITHYDESRGANFATFSSHCARREVWKEFDRQKKQRRGEFCDTIGDYLNELQNEKPSIEDELSDTEAIAYIVEELADLPPDVQELVWHHYQGESFSDIGRHQRRDRGRLSKKLKATLELLREEVMPQMMGAWTPFPSVMGDVMETLGQFGCSFREPLPPLTQRQGRACEYCGEEIPINNLQAKYCSQQCRQNAAYHRKKAKMAR